MPFKFNPLTAKLDFVNSGGGDFVGPASSTDNHLVRFDGTTGKLGQDGSTAVLSDAGALSGLTKLDVDNIEIDGNTISSTDTNGNINLTPNGVGAVILTGFTWPTTNPGGSGQYFISTSTTTASWQTVTPPATLPQIGVSTANAVARWNGVGGSAVKNSVVIIDNSGNVSGVNITTGSVLFAGASGAISQANSNFFYDSSTKSLRLGPGATSNTVTIAGFPYTASFISREDDLNNLAQMAVLRAGSTFAGAGAPFALGRARGSIGAETAVTSGDNLSSWSIIGHDGTQYQIAAQVSFDVEAAVSAGIVPTAITFKTANTSGVSTNAFSLSSAQAARLYGQVTADKDITFGIASGSPIAHALVGQDASGSNIAGTDTTLKGSRGTGTGAGGKWIMQVAPAGSTGSSLNTLVERLSVTSAQESVWNEPGLDHDLRFEGDTDTNLMFLDASSDQVIFGATTGATGVKAQTAGVHAVKMGAVSTTTDVAKVGGVISTNLTTVGNVGGGEDDLMTYTLPAGALGATNDYVEVTAMGSFANNVDLKQVKVYFGATVILDTTSLMLIAGVWTFRAKIFRTGAATQYAEIHWTKTAAGAASLIAMTNPTETLSGTVVIKVTGTSASSVTNDVVQNSMAIKWFPAP